MNQQYFQQQQQQAAAGITPQDVERIVAQRMQQVQINAAVSQFQSAKDGSGNPLYPHFETVRQTMDGILRAGLAQDLPSAYNAALRMPQHAELYDAQQKQQRDAEQAAQAKAKTDAAAKARAAAVSIKGQSPTSQAKGSGDKGSKQLRDTIADAFDQHTESSRV